MHKLQIRFFQIWLVFVCLFSSGSTPLVLADGIPLPPFPKTEKPTAQPIEKEPQDWLAFLASESGYTSSEYYALDNTPYIMVFKDGRIFWRSDNFGVLDPNRHRERWREAKLSPQKLAAFKKRLEAFNFFTIQKPAPVKAKPDSLGRIRKLVVVDAGTSLIGVQLHGKKRVVSEYALDLYANFDKNNRYFQTLVIMQKAIRALIPKESKRHEPKVIRVTLQPHGSRPSPKWVIPNWPLANIPNTKIENHFYSGDNAQTMITALGENEEVVIGDKVFSAFWAPAIAVPQPQMVKRK